MGRIKKGVLLFDLRPLEIEYPDYKGPFEEYRMKHIFLVEWLNSALLGSPMERDAAKRVGKLIEGVTDCADKTKKAIWFFGGTEKVLPSYRLRDIAPFYRFEFDLFPLGESGKWQLLLNCIYAACADRQWPNKELDEESRRELEAAAIVVDLALDGRLAKIKQCQAPDCRKWFVTKRDFRVSRCKDCRLHDRRADTAERAKQVSEASRKAHAGEKKKNERSLKNARKFLADGRKKK